MNKISPKKLKTSSEKTIKLSKDEMSQVGQAASEHIDKHLTRRLKNLHSVRRFLAGWLAMILIFSFGLIIQTKGLDSFFKEDAPAAGGVYIEGILGELNNINPIFSQSAPEESAAELIFSGLFRYDNEGAIVPDLADGWTLNEAQDIYTVTLKNDVKWHDGEPLRAQDVVFTYDLIKHPDTRSPLNSSWQDVNVQAKDDLTVTFTLPNPFTPFIHSLTNGILPSHLLADTTPLEMRSSEFNVNPVGTGLFTFNQFVIDDDTDREHVELVRNDDYFGDAAQLSEFIIEAYASREDLARAFDSGNLSAASGLDKVDIDAIKVESDEIVNPTAGGVFLFMNNSSPHLDGSGLRQALTLATDRTAINELLAESGSEINSPILQSQLKHDKDVQQLGFDKAAAIAKFDELGFVIRPDGDGVRINDIDQKLEFTLTTQDNTKFLAVANEIKEQFASVGVTININAVSSDILQQSHVLPHNYDMLLFGVELGPDPDVFVYWHSTQALTGGFNFSEYKSDLVDQALESGRTRADEQVRSAKYRTFLENWRNDAPAVALYQDNSLYITIPSVRGVGSIKLNTQTDRYADVASWTLNTSTIDKVR